MSNEIIRFTVPLPPRVLRRNTATVEREHPKPGQSKRRAVHWSDRAKARREYQEDVWIAGYFAAQPPPWKSPTTDITYPGFWPMPWPRAHVHYVWHSTHETDADNIIAAMKPALDVCKATGPRPLSLIVDDGPGVSVTAAWQKATTKAQERVEISIERRDG